MDVLETTLRPLIGMINRQIEAQTPARELCAELSGAVLAIRVRGTALAAWCEVGEVGDAGIRLSGDRGAEPDVVITGSLLALLRLAGDGSEDAIRDGAVELTGDAELAQKFRRLLRYGRPDIEEELSAVVGDVAAHGMGRFVRSAGNWGRAAGATLRANVSEYLQEESRALPSRYEADDFRARVERLRDDVARFQARLVQAENRRAGGTD